MHPLSPISLSDYHYDLPPERIANEPLEQRDTSKLLVYQQGEIQHRQFSHISAWLSKGDLVVFNDTRVIPARLFMQRATGARIELLLLKPVSPKEVNKAMSAKGYCSWECMIGNKKRWKEGETLTVSLVIGGVHTHLHASLIDRDRQWVELSWDQPELTFAELIRAAGALPLPPYLKREAREADYRQYQTVYAVHEGAVAAPTAGLHFTPEVLAALEEKGVEKDFVTLHVSAGTFQPVKAENALDHDMHAEQISVTQETLKQLLAHSPNVIAVGTTSLRLLESMYWFGVEIALAGRELPKNHDFRLAKLAPYEIDPQSLPSSQIAIELLLDHMRRHELTELVAETSIFIFPGYEFKVCKGLITNYHMPETTLILLVAAFIGEDWRRVYEEAMANGYRFLSYGDSSLLWR